MKFTLSTRLHTTMREIARRKAKQTGYALGAHYAEAFRRYIQSHKIPKRIEKVSRDQVILEVPDDMLQLREQISRLAIARQQSEQVLIEEALAAYTNEPENYLGETFYRTLPKKEYI